MKSYISYGITRKSPGFHPLVGDVTWWRHTHARAVERDKGTTMKPQSVKKYTLANFTQQICQRFTSYTKQLIVFQAIRSVSTALQAARLAAWQVARLAAWQLRYVWLPWSDSLRLTTGRYSWNTFTPRTLEKDSVRANSSGGKFVIN